MRCRIILLTVIASLALAQGKVHAQIHSFASPPCLPGQVPMAQPGPDGKPVWHCGAPPYMASDPVITRYASTCKKDTDCPGRLRCLTNGYCMRGDVGCNSDSECKYSEFCDKSKPYHLPEISGTCAPRGGHY